jgi:hypothetical protein
MIKKGLFIAVVCAGLSACGGGGGGSASSTPTNNTVSSSSSIATTSSISSSSSSAPSLGVTGKIDREKSNWYVSTITSQLTGVKTTLLELPQSFGGTFVISCSAGKFDQYYLRTSEITDNGTISYRVGTSPVEIESWNETSSFEVLVPTAPNLQFLQKLYVNTEMYMVYNAFIGGSVGVELPLSGFPATIDATREECGWPETLFPVGNNWGKSYPTEAPPTAKESTYISGNAFRVLAWVETNASGNPQILVRAGDFTGPCEGSFLIGDNAFYVTQNGKTVPAVSGTSYKISCKSPEIIALNGDYDASKPLALEVYSFHYNDLERGTPFTVINLNE